MATREQVNVRPSSEHYLALKRNFDKTLKELEEEKEKTKTLDRTLEELEEQKEKTKNLGRFVLQYIHL